MSREYLESVVTVGSGKAAQVNGFSIGGKTGTAQKYEGGKIASGKCVSSFIGFSTVEDPEYIVYFMVDEPQGYRYYGSLVAAPYVGKIFSEIFEYKQIHPTEEIVDHSYLEMPDLIGDTAGNAIKALNALGLSYEIAGNGGYVVAQYPESGEIINERSVLLITLSEE